jgi:hypothetical protein
MKTSAVIMLVLATTFSGCASMSPYEKNAFREIEDVGIKCEKVAEPGTAAVLNIFPGVGDIYLAAGNGANPTNWGAFALDLLFWPISIAWAVPQGAITADTVNKKECVGYYFHTLDGKKKLADLTKQHATLNNMEETEKITK